MVFSGVILFSPNAEARIEVEGDADFREDVNECINNYRDTEGMVGDVINELEDSENTHTITEGPDWTNTPSNNDAAFNGTGSDTETEVSKERLEELKEVAEELENKDFCAALLHELWHAVDADRGEWSNDKHSGVWEDEIEATAFQNFIHALREVPARTQYGDTDISDHLGVFGEEEIEESESPDTESEDDPEEDNEEEEQSTRNISVLIIEDKRYPANQFTVAEPDACGAEHWHAETRVYALDGSSTVDPNPNECGFGTTAELQPQEIEVTSKEIENYPGEL